MNEPTAQELLKNAEVVAGLRRAYKESGVGSDHPMEQGGFILQGPPGVIEIARLPSSAAESLAFPICADGTYRNLKIVGSFHTPNTGPDWLQKPSLQDISLSQNYPDTMGAHQFVISAETIYDIDNGGIVSVLGSTVALLGLNEA